MIEIPEPLRNELSSRGEFYMKANLSETDLDKLLPKVNVLIAGKLTEDMLSKTRSLEMVQILSAGLDGLPFKSISENILVCGNRGSNADAVAESAFAMVLALAKNIIHHQDNMRKGIFDQSERSLFLRGKVLAVLGLGEIGRRVHRIAKALGMKVYAINRSGRSDLDCDFIGTIDHLEKILREADMIVISMGLTKQTRHIISLTQLHWMKPNAILVNVGRADLIAKDDLERHIKECPNFRVGLDVWWNPDNFERDSSIMKFPNVLGMPWVAGGYGSDEVQEEMKAIAVKNVVSYLDGQKPMNIARREDYV